MKIEIYLDQVMIEKGVSQYDLQKTTNLNIKTIRSIRTGENVNPSIFVYYNGATKTTGKLMAIACTFVKND